MKRRPSEGASTTAIVLFGLITFIAVIVAALMLWYQDGHGAVLSGFIAVGAGTACRMLYQYHCTVDELMTTRKPEPPAQTKD